MALACRGLALRPTTYRLLAPPLRIFFFFNDTATTEIYTLSLHDALPIFRELLTYMIEDPKTVSRALHLLLISRNMERIAEDRKSTRLNSSHMSISYAVFCLKKKKQSRKMDLTARRERSHLPPSTPLAAAR